MDVKVTPVADGEELATALAQRWLAAAQEAIAERGVFYVALAGGSTPQAAYERLATEAYAARVDWHRVQVFWGDERPVPPDHPDSNYRMAYEALLRKVPVPEANVHRLRGEAQDLEAAAGEYAAELARTFGIPADGNPPRFDLVLLGMGAEGHTASLFPDSPALQSTRWVEAPFVPQLGMRRLTLTPRVLNAARRIVFAVGGKGKAQALRAVLRGPRQPERLPAQAITPADGTLEWLVERALVEAAGL